jgi:hypothetical protein
MTYPHQLTYSTLFGHHIRMRVRFVRNLVNVIHFATQKYRGLGWKLNTILESARVLVYLYVLVLGFSLNMHRLTQPVGKLSAEVIKKPLFHD